jgi:GH24 family phage-related lysozyme (muramidase)
MMNPSDDLQTTKDLIERHECRTNTMQSDAQGNLTIGVGFRMDRSDARERVEAVGANYDRVRSGAESLTDSQVERLFDADVRDAQATARKEVPRFDALPQSGQDVVTDMVFHLGASGFLQFKTMVEAIEQADWHTAEEMLDATSSWRARRLDTHNAELRSLGDQRQ